MLPEDEVGMYPIVFASVSESVSGSSPHDGVLARTVTDADAALADESPVLTFAMVVNMYAVPAVKPVMMHDPDAPVTVHVAPSGVAVTTYDVGVSPPVGAVTVIVACSPPATTVATPGVFGAVLARTVTDADAALAAEL